MNDADLSIDCNKLTFWRKNAKKYLLLSDFAFELLNIPTTPIPFHQTFTNNFNKLQKTNFEISKEQTYQILREIEQNAVLRINQRFTTQPM